MKVQQRHHRTSEAAEDEERERWWWICEEIVEGEPKGHNGAKPERHKGWGVQTNLKIDPDFGLIQAGKYAPPPFDGDARARESIAQTLRYDAEAAIRAYAEIERVDILRSQLIGNSTRLTASGGAAQSVGKRCSWLRRFEHYAPAYEDGSSRLGPEA